MAEKAIFEIVVTEKGLRVTQKGVEQLGNEVEKTSRKQKGASKAADELNYKLNQGTVGASSAARSFSKLNQAIGAGPNGLVGAYATLAANAFAVSAAFNALREAAMLEQVMRGLEIQSGRTGQALTVTAQRVQELSGFTLSLGESMQATAQASAAGFSTETIERITNAAADASAALGRNMPDSMDRLIKGLTKMEPELLDELGAMTKLTEASRMYALQTGKSEASLSSLEKRTALSNAVLAELELKFGGVAREANASAREYDRLAATFKDTTNQVLNFISAGILPLISFLNQNKLALAALGVAFFSTIKSQIAPGLAMLAKEQAKAAEKQKEDSDKQIASINKLGSGKRKAYNELVESIKAGTQTEEQYTKATEELAARRSSILAKTYKDQEKGEKLRAVQLGKLIKEEEALTAAQSATIKSKREQAVAAAVSSTENANLFNVFGKLKETFSETRTALAANSQAMAAGATTGSKLTNTFALLRSQAAITGKVLGSAFLNLIPVLGQLLFVLSLVGEAFELLKSKQRKALEASAATLNEVLASSAAAAGELRRISESTAVLSVRTEKELIIRGNAVQSLASSYEDLAASIEKAVKSQNNLTGRTGTAGFFDLLGITDELEIQSFNLGIDQSSKILQEASAKSEKGLLKLGAAFNPLRSEQELLTRESVKTLAALENVVPERTFNRVIQLNGGLEKVVGSTKLTRKVVNELADAMGGPLAEAAKEVTQAFKTTDEALSEFNKSAIISTPYDNVVKSMDAMSNSLINLSMAAGDNVDWSGILSGVGPLLEARLTEGNRAIIEQARTSDATIQSLEKARKELGSLTVEQEQVLKLEQAKLNTAKDQLPLVAANIQLERDRFIRAQAVTRELQGQVGIIQAIISRNQEVYGRAGGAGERARIEREEQIRNIQIETLRIQKQQIEASLQIVRQKIEEIKAQKLLNKELGITVASEQASASQQALRTAQASALALGVTPELVTPTRLREGDNMPMFRVPSAPLTEDQQSALKQVRLAALMAERDKQRLKDEQDLSAFKAQARDLEASALNISRQISAIAMQNLSAKEKIARINQAEVEVQNQIKSANTEITNQTITNANLAERLARANGDAVNSVLDSINDINSQYKTNLNNLTTESQNRINSLNAQLETATQARAQATGAEIAAYDSLINILKTSITQEEIRRDIKKDELNLRKQLDTIERLGLSTAAQRIQYQIESLSYQQKIVDTIRNSVQAETELANLQRSFQLRRLGASSEQISRIENIKNAETALKIAESEATLKKNLIRLEFALLEERRKQALREAATRLQSIDQTSELGKEAAASVKASIAAMGGALGEDGSVKFGEGILGYAEEAVKVIDSGIEQARTRLEEAKFRRRTTGPGDIIGGVQASIEEARARYGTAEDAPLGFEGALSVAADVTRMHVDSIKSALAELGPEGAVAIALGEGMATMTASFADFADAMKSGDSTQKLVAGLNTASAVLSTVASITKATSDAKIASVEREIAAEQKRDGKSAESVAKIQALEKKKDDIARKSFNTQKKIMMAQAVISTAAAIAAALTAGPIAGPILAGIIGAMGAAQLAIIAGTQYQSSSTRTTTAQPPSTLSIGRRSDTVDLARGPSASAGGEVGFIRGSQGMGTNASNFRTIGSAYGGELMRGFGNRGFVVGEKGPEIITPETPINVTPANETMGATPVNATFNIQALDASGVQDILVSQKGNIIKMIRDAANASGQGFLEDVNVNVYTRPSVNKL